MLLYCLKIPKDVINVSVHKNGCQFLISSITNKCLLLFCQLTIVKEFLRNIKSPQPTEIQNILLKFIYSERATKLCEIFNLLLSYVVPVKSKEKILQNFVAFSEYLYELNIYYLLCVMYDLNFRYC